MNLNIPEENKILLSKIERRVPFLSKRCLTYFENVKTVKSDKIEEAYAINEDLISILSTNNQKIEDVKNESKSIRQKHQVDFTKEINLDITKQLEESNIIRSTIDQKDKLIKAEDKLSLLNKRRKYIETKNKKRKEEFEFDSQKLMQRINDENILDIQPMKEDITLINKFIDEREIRKYRWLYILIPILILIIILTLGGVLLWTL